MPDKIYDPGLQYLAISYPPNAGLDNQGLLHFFDEFDDDLKSRGLRPVLLYNLTIPSLKAHFRALVDPVQSVLPISRFLAETWEVGGIPDRLEVSKDLLLADRGFSTWVRDQGVTLAPAASIKTLAGFNKVHRNLTYFVRALKEKKPDYASPIPLDIANANLKEHDKLINAIRQGSSNLPNLTVFRQHPRRPFRSDHPPSTTPDWDAGLMRLPVSRRISPTHRLEADEPQNFSIYEAKEVIALWPMGKKAFAKSAGLTVREVDNWIGYHAHCPEHAIPKIIEMLRVEYDDSVDSWIFDGGLLLVANGRRQTMAAYDALSGGGDLNIAREVISPNGIHAKTHRFLYFEANGRAGNIILFPIGAPEENLLDSDSLINLQPPVEATHEVWMDVLQIMDNYPLEISCDAGLKFMQRHLDWLEQFERSW